jgi:hypothetical protein
VMSARSAYSERTVVGSVERGNYRYRSGRKSLGRSAGGRSCSLNIGVKEAKALGVISEIVARDRPLHRAREIAGRIANLPPVTASYTRVALTQKVLRVVDESVGYGLALEGISAADVARSRAP